MLENDNNEVKLSTQEKLRQKELKKLNPNLFEDQEQSVKLIKEKGFPLIKFAVDIRTTKEYQILDVILTTDTR